MLKESEHIKYSAYIMLQDKLGVPVSKSKGVGADQSNENEGDQIRI